MAIATYDSDLTSANNGLVDEALTVGNWDESSVSAWADGGTETAEGNFYIQGTDCISAQFTKTGVGSLLNDVNQFAGAFTVDIDGAITIWAFWAAPASLATYANGGIRTIVGDTLGDFYAFKASGSDFEPNPFGGWYNYAIDPNTATPDTTVGTPDNTWSIVGIAINATAQSRGNPFAVDSIRVGRCTLEIINGQAAAYGTFTGMSDFDTSTTERYALFQQVFGGYKWQGLMSLGTTATAVDFRDSNANIFVANTPNVSSNFNKIEIRNVGSNVEWTSINISAQDGVNNVIASTASRGNFEVVDNATLVNNVCSFTDMGTFIYLSNSTLNNTTYRRCDLVTTGGATFNSCIFDSTIAASATLTTDLAKLNGCDFTSDGSSHAVELTSIGAGTMSWNCSTSGYDTGSTGSPVTPTSTGNEDIYVNVTTASDLTINVADGATTPSIRVSAGFTGSVNVVAGQKSFNFTVNPAIIDYEWRLYEDSGVSGELGTVLLAGEESASSSTQSPAYTYSYTIDTDIVLQIIADDYEEVNHYNTLENSDKSVTINLSVDDNL